MELEVRDSVRPVAPKEPAFPWELVLVVPIAVVLAVVAGLASAGAASDAKWTPVEAALRDVSVRTSRGNKGGPYLVVRASYEYSVDGRSYIGTRYQRDWMDDVEDESFKAGPEADQRVAELRAKKVITVHYDPADPSKSFRTPRPPGEAHFPGVLALTGFLFGLVRVGHWSWARRRLKRATPRG